MKRSCFPHSSVFPLLLWIFPLSGLLPPGISFAQRAGGEPVARPVYDQWTTYLNARFYYQVPVPPGLRARQDPKRGGACRFASDDGVLILKVWGSQLMVKEGDPLQAAWGESLSIRDRRIDFQRRTPMGFVMAGMNSDGSEYFEKVILGNGAIAGMNVSFPASQSPRFAPAVQEIERGFGWHPDAAALTREGVPPRRGLFSGVQEYFTGEDQPPGSPLAPGTGAEPGARNSPETKVDLTPPPAPPSPSAKPKASPPVPASERPAVTPPPVTSKPVPAKGGDLPVGIGIPGKKGYVYSPYGGDKQQVDVTGIPAGTKVKCPYTGKVFRVP